MVFSHSIWCSMNAPMCVAVSLHIMDHDGLTNIQPSPAQPVFRAMISVLQSERKILGMKYSVKTTSSPNAVFARALIHSPSALAPWDSGPGDAGLSVLI
jgi:hypothetical protein